MEINIKGTPDEVRKFVGSSLQAKGVQVTPSQQLSLRRLIYDIVGNRVGAQPAEKATETINHLTTIVATRWMEEQDVIIMSALEGNLNENMYLVIAKAWKDDIFILINAPFDGAVGVWCGTISELVKLDDIMPEMVRESLYWQATLARNRDFEHENA